MSKKRIIGFDVARALAVFGMVLVNFKVALTADNGNEFLLWISGLFEGRASALFVVLAGVGITFLSNKARHSGDKTIINDTRKAIIKRGFLLFLIGLSYATIWEADILHLYAFYFLIAAMLITTSNKKLLFVSG
ncbi:MAG: heparan-alpha-glucosaminide N-acetyltransferase domain-containing protein, partial [Proteobacteria bacterium]|nr:heparan-alpha-glucosaminide N-acetyltransferase domain-containing protein [Pseudomonadota bacterium]